MLRKHGCDKVKDVLHSHSQLPATLTMNLVSRPPSAVPFLSDQASVMLTRASQPNQNALQRSVSRLTRGPSIGTTALDHAITITHVVDTMRNSPTAPPSAAPGFASPQLLVHRPDAAD